MRFSTSEESLTDPLSILVSAGHSADRWVVRGIAIGGIQLPFFPNTCSYTSVIVFTTILHGFTPRLGVYLMNVGVFPHDLTDAHTCARY